MDKKTLKFRDSLAQLVLKGEKDVTWRLFDDKDLKVGDEVDLTNWDSRQKFASALLIEVREKLLCRLESSDYDGHEKFENDEEMYETYRTYYGDTVGPDTLVKIIRFKLINP